MEDIKSASDEKIVDYVRRQDQELYREIISRYQAKLLRYANYITHNETEAADVVQNSFIKAFINLNGFNNKLKFSSWIYRIVHNEAINALKKNKKEEPILQGMDFLSHEDILENLAKNEEEKNVELCISQLPLIYSEPLSLLILESRSYEEIRDILRLPIGTVSSRINRGKILIKKICQKIIK